MWFLLLTILRTLADRKNVPHSRGLKKADLLIKDFQLAGVRDRHHRRDLAPRIPWLMRQPSTQRGALTPRRHRCTGCHQAQRSRKSSKTTNTTTTCTVSSSFGSQDDLRENRRRLSRLLYILSHRQAADYFTRMCTGHRHEDRHRPTQAPSQKAPSPRPRPPPLQHPSTRPPP